MRFELILVLLSSVFTALVNIEKVSELEELTITNEKFALLVTKNDCERCKQALSAFKLYSTKANFPFFSVEEELYAMAPAAGKPAAFPLLVYGFQGNIVPLRSLSYLNLFLTRITTDPSEFSKKPGDSLILFTPTPKSKEIFSQLSSLLSPLFDNVMHIDAETDSILSLNTKSLVITLDSVSSIASLTRPDTLLNSNQLREFFKETELSLKSALSKTFLPYSARSSFHFSLFPSYLVFSGGEPSFEPVFDSLADDCLKARFEAFLVKYDCSGNLKVDCSKPAITLFAEEKTVSSVEEGRFNLQTVSELLGKQPEEPTKIPVKTTTSVRKESPPYRYFFYFLVYSLIFFFVYRKYFRASGYETL